MNVPEVIDRGNATFLAPAQRALKEGKTVIVAYDGLHAASFQQYDTREQAMQALVGLQNSVAATPSIHFKVLFPDGSELAADRPAVQLLDNEPDDPILPGPGAGQDGPQLTAEEDGALQVAVTQRGRAAGRRLRLRQGAGRVHRPGREVARPAAGRRRHRRPDPQLIPNPPAKEPAP